MAQAEKEYDHVECRAKWTNYAPHDQVRQVDELKVFMAGRYCVTEQTGVWTPSGHLSWPVVTGSNARYRFELKSNREAWVLTNVAPPYDLFASLQAPFALPQASHTYSGILNRPDSRVVGQSRVEWRGQPHDEWIIDAVTETWKTRKPVKNRLGLFVRPDRPGLVYGVRVYDRENPTQWLREFVIEYEATEERWPAPKVVEEYVTDKTEWLRDKAAPYKPWRVSRYDITLWRRLPPGPPGREFTLSGYGLPEPKDVPEEGFQPPAGGSINLMPVGPAPPAKDPGHRIWLWVVLGLVLLVAGLTYVRYRRRRT